MRLLRIGPAGAEKPAVLDEDGVARDASALVSEYDGSFFAGGGIERLRERVARDGFEALPMVEPVGRVGAPIVQPSKIICVGLNYRDHAEESGMAAPDEPILFFKAPNTVVGPNDDLLIPPGSVKTDWEVELGVVIGRTARYLPDEDAAASVIAGYVLSHDVSEREFQLERGGQWVKGKSCETFNPLGPWLVTPDEVGDPQQLDIWLEINGERVQDGSTSDMIFPAVHLVWYISQFMVLEPGDLVNTGTPAGVGMGLSPPRFLRSGERIDLAIAGLGEQHQKAVQAAR
jgi:2-keto-4-pentenoate hydratase/2-oxohepta-3-ene-1,7-dioic acid hydratase in catechol pathway